MYKQLRHKKSHYAIEREANTIVQYTLGIAGVLILFWVWVVFVAWLWRATFRECREYRDFRRLSVHTRLHNRPLRFPVDFQMELV